VIVEPRVLILAPADHPCVDNWVIPDLLVHAHVGRVPNRVAPEAGGSGQARDEAFELKRGGAHAARVVAAAATVCPEESMPSSIQH
jgi:hypothetical protein